MSMDLTATLLRHLRCGDRDQSQSAKNSPRPFRNHFLCASGSQSDLVNVNRLDEALAHERRRIEFREELGTSQRFENRVDAVGIEPGAGSYGAERDDFSGPQFIQQLLEALPAPVRRC